MVIKNKNQQQLMILTNLVNKYLQIIITYFFFIYILGTTRKDWSKPDQVVANDPPYGKAGGSTDTHNPNQGKN